MNEKDFEKFVRFFFTENDVKKLIKSASQGRATLAEYGIFEKDGTYYHDPLKQFSIDLRKPLEKIFEIVKQFSEII